MNEHDPDRRADELGREADKLEQQSRELAEQVTNVRQDWEQKRSDPSIPGANPPESESENGEDTPPPESADPTGGTHSQPDDDS